MNKVIISKTVSNKFVLPFQIVNKKLFIADIETDVTYDVK